MKQRTFLTTLGLFLLFFNLSNFFVANTVFRDTIRGAEERSLGEHYFIASALSGDFQAVESRGAEIDGSIASLLEPYRYLAGDNKGGLALYREGQLIYAYKDAPSILEKSFLSPPEEGKRLVTVRRAEVKTYVMVSGRLPLPYAEYTLVYFYDTSEAISSWNHLKNTLFLGGLVLSVLLACGLLLVLNRIFRPLQQISRTSRDIARGEYGTRLTVSGQDELSEMARSFNHMAGEIQRQMAELKEATARKQEFVDNFAHELRTPLTAIYGYAEYMQKAVVSEEERLSALSYIMAESRRLQTIGTQLLAIANLQNQPLSREEQKVAGLFAAARRTLQGRLAAQGVELEFNLGIETVWGDASLLESLLINLIDNGIKACPEGGRIIVSAALEEERKVIKVKDNGKGMTPEVLSQITEPFYRGEKSRDRSDGGAGLGLAICRQIALSHQAELSFTSCPEKGTTAKITFTTS